MPAVKAAASPAVVGGFVLGALLIGVVAALVLGGTRWFRPSVHVLVVFKDSVAGLTAGSPVTFRGVAIGKVQSVKVRVNGADRAPVVQVYLDLEPDQLSWTNRASPNEQADLQSAINAGLRAQLISQSLVTGELNVDIDFYPNTPAVLVGSPDGDLEIPTIPSELQSFKDQVREMNLPQIAIQTRQALVTLQQDLDGVKGEIGPVSQDLRTTLQATTSAVSALEHRSTETLTRLNGLVATSHAQLEKEGDRLDQLLQSAQRTTAQTEQLAASLNDMADLRSPMRNDLDAALRDLAASSSSLRQFTHDLQRNPAGTLLRRAAP